PFLFGLAMVPRLPGPRPRIWATTLSIHSSRDGRVLCLDPDLDDFDRAKPRHHTVSASREIPAAFGALCGFRFHLPLTTGQPYLVYTFAAMTNIDKHSAGSFCWIELHTSDQNAAKSFYAALFGWQPEDMPMGPNDFYTVFKLQGRDAAAGCSLRPEQRAQSVPSHWTIYIAVENADAAVAKAEQLGGKVLAPAFDVMDAGRMAWVQDPTGADFCFWQARRNTGIGISHVH